MIHLYEYIFNTDEKDWKVKSISCTFTNNKVLYAWDVSPAFLRIFPDFGLDEYLRVLFGERLIFDYRTYKHSEYWSIEDIILDLKPPERLNFVLGDYLRISRKAKQKLEIKQ